MESMDNIMNRENQMTNFYNIRNNNESEIEGNGNNVTQHFATNSFMKSICNDDSLVTRNVSTISGKHPEFKETA